MAVGDLDGDHRLDVAVAESGQVYALTNLGGGQLAPPVKIEGVSGWGGTIAIADLDGDGKQDLIVNEVHVGTWLNQGGLAFSHASVQIGFLEGISVETFAATDLNHDGAIDLVAVGRVPMVDLFQGHEGIALNDGHGTFMNGEFLPIPRTDGYPFEIATGDVDGDGRMDFVVAAHATASAGTLTTFKGRGDGTFQSIACPVTILLDAGLAAGDLNGDGKVNLALRTDSGIGLQVAVGP